MLHDTSYRVAYRAYYNKTAHTITMSKLYATSTSEKASKGQGGNKHLTTVYTGEDGYKFLEVGMSIPTASTNHAIVTIKDATGKVVFDRVLKISLHTKPCKHDWDNYFKCTKCGTWNL